MDSSNPLNNLTEYVGINDLMTAESVNDTDAIVGYGIDSNYEYRGYLLRPNV